MAILDQSKAISLIFEKIKSKFVHSTFIIHKNRNKTSIQPILKSNYTSFIIIIYHDFLTTPRRGSHVKSGKTQAI